MYSISNISVFYPGKEILTNVSFIINPRDRIGLIGKNGAGKTTLLNLIAGLMKPDNGGVQIPDGKTVGYLPQELNFQSDKTIYQETMTAFKEITMLENEIHLINDQIVTRKDFHSDSYLDLLNQLNEKHQRFDYLEGNKRESNLERILKGLGFKETDFDRKLDEFSGGWQMRVELAKLLLRRPDLVLLDEPTNHLDIESILWLEEFLKSYPGAIVMVSHDKMFLDNICLRTIELINAKIYDYKLNYSRFLEIREERLESQVATARNQQRFIDQQERFITRFRAKSTKAKQVQSKIRQLEKLEKVEFDDQDNRTIGFRFPPAPRSGTVSLEAKNVSKNYGHNEILKNLEFTIERGERVAFVGKNGEGKTTLVKMICSGIDYDGELKIGFNVKIGYYAQVQEKNLDEDMTVLQTIENDATGEWASVSKIRGLLGAFLFREDDWDKKVRVLSGGEKSRLAIAKLLLSPANFLILDEPTNHLDISSKEVLKNALMKFDGTLIIVSHDRDFLQGLTIKTYEFLNKGIKEHLGDISEFLRNHKVESFREFEVTNKKSNVSTQNEDDIQVSKDKYLLKKEADKEIRKLTNNVKKLEEKVAELEKSILKIENEMQKPDFFKDTKKARELSTTHSKLNDELAMVLGEWEKAHDLVEKAQIKS